MATENANEIVVGGTGKVSVAPAGTALPTTISAALNAAFDAVGFVSEDGVTFTDNTENEDVLGWQAFYPLRKIQVSKESTLEFIMRQWNQDTIKTAFGGGTFSTAAGVTTYSPPEPGVMTYKAMVIDWTDGARKFRLCVPRGMVTGEVSSTIARTSAADLPVSFSVLPLTSPTPGTLSTYPWYLVTDDAQFTVT